MNLPIAPPAFDATEGAKETQRADTGADVGVGCALMFVEVVALGVVFGLWFLSGVNLDPAENGHADSLWGYLLAAGGVGVFALVAAVLAARVGALVTVVGQGVVVLLVAALCFGGAAAQSHEDRSARPPTPSTGGTHPSPSP